MRAVSIYVLFWLILLILAIGNGVLREASYGQHLPELRSHQLSTLLAALAFGGSVWLLAQRQIPDSMAQAVLIGFVWLALTVFFEFLFGHYIAGHSWSRLLQDYNLMAGRLWPLLLLWVTVLPCIVYKVYGPAN